MLKNFRSGHVQTGRNVYYRFFSSRQIEQKDIKQTTSTIFPPKYWQSIENQRKFMDSIKDHFNYQAPNDWNKLTHQHIRKQGGRQLLKYYPSIYHLLRSVYPEENWSPFSIPRHYPVSKWDDPAVQRDYFQQLSKYKQTPLLQLTKKDVLEHYGANLLKKIPTKSLALHLEKLFPQADPPNLWKSLSKQRAFMDELKEKMKITSATDWRRIKEADIYNAGGGSLLRFHGRSQKRLLSVVYPEITWEEIFPSLSPSRQAKILENISQSEKIQSMEDWIRLPLAKFYRSGGREVLQEFDSFLEMLVFHFPERNWVPYEFPVSKLPRGFWSCMENQMKFLEYAETELQIQSVGDWRDVPIYKFIQLGGVTLLQRYKTLCNLLVHLKPEENWKEILKPSQQELWDDQVHQREFCDELIMRLKLSKPVELLHVKYEFIRGCRESVLLNRRNGKSFFELLRELYPSENWDISDEFRLPRNYLKREEHRRELLETLGEKHFHIQDLDDWRHVSVAEFREKGGNGLLQYYPSFLDMLKSLYPSHSWDFVTKQRKLPPFYWDNFENIREFIKRMEQQYKVIQADDWYRISTRQIIASGGNGLLLNYNFVEILKQVYPDVSWDESRFNRKDKRSSQRWLCLSVKQLYPEDEVIEEYTFNDCIRESGKAIQVDVYVPKYRIAFEYNGEHHYKEIPAFGSVEMYQQLDKEKMELCKQNNIRLVNVPYLWDEKLDSLRKLIHENTYIP